MSRFLLLVLGAFAVSTVVAESSTRWPPNRALQFDHFKKKFERTYKSIEEEAHRFEIFVQNLGKIEASNAKGLSYTLGITDFADLTFEEWRQLYLNGFKKPAFKSLGVFLAPENFTEPDAVDWVTKGGVTPVKNQGHCGSCWTFSATGALEGATFVAKGTLPSLSEQNIVDCDTGGHACKGGSMDQAFDWVKTNGICSESDYSYKCMNQDSTECKSSKCSATCTKVLKAGDVTGHTDVGQTEGALEAAVAQQPVSVAIEADQAVFQHYTGGVLTNDACGSNLDHGVLAVGYGTDNGKKYWKVKNSWGTTFGEQGYIRIEKGDPSPGGECGIRKAAVFPTVAKSAIEEIVV